MLELGLGFIKCDWVSVKVSVRARDLIDVTARVRVRRYGSGYG